MVRSDASPLDGTRIVSGEAWWNPTDYPSDAQHEVQELLLRVTLRRERFER